MTQEIQRVGVVGCGLMGAGIAEVCARAGYMVVVREVNKDFLEAGMARINSSLDKAVARGKLPAASRDQARARIIGATDMGAFSGCDLIVEAAPENLALKRKIFAELDAVAPAYAILASNTSSLAVTEMAAATRRPAQVLGLHFMQPVPVMPLLEMVRTFLTGEEVFQRARAFGESLGKTIVVSKDTPGFIVNLLLIPYLLHAIEALEKGVATQEDFDTAIKLGLNHPMGPFTLLDFVGLDTALFIADAVFEETRDPRFAAPPLLRRMVSAGYLGKKSGRGFYEYGK
ncbi:MAG: 3-hydroxybutyryl-CoA dehydrogenase [Anaerolineae bacterium CG2_30_64_16]|nr:MAG: 3-hydroxybutyryl-CoA dehydrogenase [Anaerolineae bacterium CG2_30_64_16]